MKKDKIIIFFKKNKWFILAILVVIYSFYQFEYKPKQIISGCEKDAHIESEKSLSANLNYDSNFQGCLRAHGIIF